MARETKMILITSNEDLIRQFFLNKAANTRIIDIDNDNRMTSTINDNDMTDLALFAGLSELNSSSDQVYKRALESPDHSRSKPTKGPKKSIDMTCSICGDRAIGFNYDVLSCASCKAFFRRNANQNREQLRCLTGQGQCSVAHETRRKCQRCRLDRCFATGMRKDFILSDEDKQKRKKCLEENRNNTAKRLSTSESTNSSPVSNSISDSESLSLAVNEIDRLLMTINNNNNIVGYDSTDFNEMEKTLFEVLSVEDWITIQSLQSSFISFFEIPPLKFNDIFDLSDRDSALISWSQFNNQLSLRFINFFRQIDEFESLHADDRFILIKYNLFSVFPIFKCFNHKQPSDFCSFENSEQENKKRLLVMLFGGPNDIHGLLPTLVVSLIEITGQDPMLLSLLLTVLLFTQGLSMSEDEPPLKDPLAVNRAQAHYTKLLWNYLVNKWGEIQACRLFTQLLTRLFRMQSVTKTLREFYRVQYMTSNTLDRIAPLMQTVLHIS